MLAIKKTYNIQNKELNERAKSNLNVKKQYIDKNIYPFYPCFVESKNQIMAKEELITLLYSFMR